MPSHVRRRTGRRALAAVVCLSYWAVPGHAATSTWNAISGNWSVSGNWNPSGAPLSGTVLITNADATFRTITFDESSTVSLTALTVDNTGATNNSGATDTLSMTSTGLSLSSANEYIGNSNSTTLSGDGAMIQSVGTNSVSSALYLGDNADDLGTYSLSGPSGTQIMAAAEEIGYGGTGDFFQSGGTNTDNGGFAIGFAANSVGEYFLTSGAFVANAGEAIGEGGSGIFIQTGGTHTLASGNLNLGFNTGSTGTYTLSGGTATITSGNVNVGGNSGGGAGKGNLTVTSTGVLSLANTATINVYNTTGTSLTLSGGTINTGALNLSGNPALFNFTGGTLNWNNSAVNAIVDSTSSANLGNALSFSSGQTLTVAGSEIVGDAGTGSVNQAAGTNTVTSGNLDIGYNAGSTGTYTVGVGANLSVSSGNVYVGGNSSAAGGKGSLIVSGSGGVLTTSSTSTITVYNTPGSGLTLTNNGTINTGALNFSGNPNLFSFTGGTLNWNNSAVPAIVDSASDANLVANGTVLNTNEVLNVAGSEIIGDTGSGNLTWNPLFATNTAGYLYLGYASGSNGTYFLERGNLTTPKMSVGYSGTGTFTEGGLSTLFNNGSGFINVGDQPGGSGIFNLNNGSVTGGTLTLGNSSASGPLAAATGTFNQINGSATFTTVILGQNAGASGSYNLSSISNIPCTLSVSGAEYSGSSGNGTFMQSGGTNIAATLYVGYANGSVGSYTLSGNSTLTVPQVHDGYIGTGTFTQSGGTFTSSSYITVGDQAGGSGVFNLSGGTLNGTSLNLGYSSSNGVLPPATGTFNQTSGAATFANITLGENPSASGFYNLSNGAGLTTPSLTVTSTENVGYLGTGTFIQTGGTNSALDLDVGIYSNGTYTLGGNGVLSTSDTTNGGGEDIGADGGTGIFNQSGGTNKVSGGLFVGYASGSQGTYNLSGSGVLSVAMGELIGGYGTGGTGGGTGTFNQSAGTNTASGGLIIGDLSSGAYNLSGGTATISTVTVGNGGGNGGVGTLSVSSVGVLNVTGTITVASNGSIINLSGGTINTAALNFGGGPSLLNWTAGTLDITTNITWDSAAANTSTSDAFLAALSIGTGQTLMVTGNETLGGAGPFALTLNSGGSHYVTGSVTLSPTGTITQNTGSTLYDSSFTQAGGTINGTLQNQSQFIYQSGAFNGRLLNQGTLSLGSNFTAGNGIENDTTMSLSSGQTITVNGAGLDNLGTFSLTGGTLSGSGIVTNDYGGTLTGYGAINPALTNDGILSLAGVLRLGSTIANHGIIQGNGTIIGNFSNTGGGNLDVPVNDTLAVSSAWTNSSLVTIEGSDAVLGGGTITNTGTIQGAGNITAPISNTTGVIRASGGELDLNGTGDTNGSSAQIQSATGNTVVVVQGLSTNSGLIALNGGTFDNDNQPMSNTGTISGDGTLLTGNLTNASTGLVLLTDENSSVYGPVTNSAGGNIKIVSNTTTFYGAVTNNGTIKVTSGVANFLGNGVSMTVGGTYNSDPSANYFNGLATTSTGLVTGGAGNQFFLANGSTFTNAGTFTDGGTLSAGAVTNTGTFTQTGTLTETGNFTNSGTTTVGGAQTWSPGTTFLNTSGTAALLTDAGSASVFNLSVNITGGKVALQSPQHWAALAISNGATLDVENNHVIINYGSGPDPIASIAGYLQTGYAAGAWNGPGISSSAAAANSASYGIGYADSADPGNPANLSSGTIEIKYTLLGDADLSGVVDGTDFGIVAANFNKGVSRWDQGDFNYDNVVDGTDFGDLAANFNKGANGASIGPGALSDPALVAFAAANGLLADLPEPSSTMLAFAAVGFFARRRRRCGKVR